MLITETQIVSREKKSNICASEKRWYRSG